MPGGGGNGSAPPGFQTSNDIITGNGSILTKCVQYSGDLNIGLVRYSNGPKQSDCRMVRYSNAICPPASEASRGVY